MVRKVSQVDNPALVPSQRDVLEAAFRARNRAVKFLLGHVVSSGLAFSGMAFDLPHVAPFAALYFFIAVPVAIALLAWLAWKQIVFVRLGGQAELQAFHLPDPDEVRVDTHDGGVGYGASMSPEVYREIADQRLVADAQKAFEDRNRFVRNALLALAASAFLVITLFSEFLSGFVWLCFFTGMLFSLGAIVVFLTLAVAKQAYYSLLGGAESRGLDAAQSAAEFEAEFTRFKLWRFSTWLLFALGSYGLPVSSALGPFSTVARAFVTWVLIFSLVSFLLISKVLQYLSLTGALPRLKLLEDLVSWIYRHRPRVKLPRWMRWIPWALMTVFALFILASLFVFPADGGRREAVLDPADPSVLHVHLGSDAFEEFMSSEFSLNSGSPSLRSPVEVTGTDEMIFVSSRYSFGRASISDAEVTFKVYRSDGAPWVLSSGDLLEVTVSVSDESSVQSGRVVVPVVVES